MSAPMNYTILGNYFNQKELIMKIEVKEVKTNPNEAELFLKFFKLGEKLALDTYKGGAND